MSTLPAIKATDDGLEISIAGARRLLDLVLEKQQEMGIGEHPDLVHKLAIVELRGVAPIHLFPTNKTAKEAAAKIDSLSQADEADG